MPEAADVRAQGGRLVDARRTLTRPYALCTGAAYEDGTGVPVKRPRSWWPASSPESAGPNQSSWKKGESYHSMSSAASRV